MKQMNDDLMIDESDEYLLRVTSQLNDELKDIKVSEDLISRTLEKAKLSQETKLHSSSSDEKIKHKEDTKFSMLDRKRHFRWITTLAGVAAACFALMIGSKVLFQGYSNKKESSSKAEFTDEDRVAKTESSARTEGSDIMYGATAEDVASNEKSQEVAGEEETLINQGTTDNQADVNIEEPEVAAVTTSGESPKLTITMNENGDVKEITGMSTIAYEDAILIGAKEEQVYVYQKSDNEQQTQALLELFISDELKLSAEEVTDTWDYYIILSMDENSAILYRIGNDHQVVANVYGSDGKSEDVVYQVEDMKKFCESLELILNEEK